MFNSDKFTVFSLKDNSRWIPQGEFLRQDQAMELSQRIIKMQSAGEVKIVREREQILGNTKEEIVFHKVIKTQSLSQIHIFNPDPLKEIVATPQDFARGEVRIAFARTLSEYLFDKTQSASDILFDPAKSSTFVYQNEPMAAAALYKLYLAARKHENTSPKDGSLRLNHAYKQLSNETNAVLSAFGHKAKKLELAAELANDFDIASESNDLTIATLITACCAKGEFENRLQNFFDFGKLNGKADIWRHVDLFVAEYLSIGDFMAALVRPQNKKLSSTILEAIKFIGGIAPNGTDFCWKPSVIIAKGIKVGMLPMTRKVCIREVIRLLVSTEPLAPGSQEEERAEYNLIERALINKKTGVLGGPVMEKALENRLRTITERN